MSGGEPAIVHVHQPAADRAGYDIVVGAGSLAALPARVAATRPARCVIIADETVAALHGDAVGQLLQSAGLPTDLLTFAAGEAHKTRDSWAALTDRIFALGCGRDTCVVALGGGVTGDLAGFVAATCMRGLPVVQVPTTLLAMIDAAVGGKTGVDTPAGKNLVGAFHPPVAVIADTRLLRSLPAAELRGGLAEAVKHGAILDAPYLESIARDAAALLAADAAVLDTLVLRSVQLKAAVVAADPLEHGQRAILNFGHTVGHALELDSAFTLPHGEAVAIGMVVEAAAGERLGVTAPGTCQRLLAVLQHCGLAARPPAMEPARLRDIMSLDKKSRRGRPRFVLLARIGEVARDGSEWTHSVPDDVLAGALRSAFQGVPVV